MTSEASEIARLSVLVQRLLDEEMLVDTQGAAILAEAEAALRQSQEGHPKEARLHVERVALFTKALVHTGALGLADGQKVITTANRILNPQGNSI